MTYEPLDVVVVPFPFTDRQATKRRPALVVSSEEFNRMHQHVILAMITSAPGPAWSSDVVLADWRKARLTVPCKVRVRLFTLNNSLILRRVGVLSGEDAAAVRATFSRFLTFR